MKCHDCPDLISERMPANFVPRAVCCCENLHLEISELQIKQELGLVDRQPNSPNRAARRALARSK